MRKDRIGPETARILNEIIPKRYTFYASTVRGRSAHTRGRRIEFHFLAVLPKSPSLGGRNSPASPHAHRGGERGRRAFGALPPPVPPTVRVHIHYWPRPPLAFCSIVFIRPLRVRRVLTTPDDFLLARGRSATRRPCNALGGGAKKTMPALLVETGEAGQHWETVQL